MTKEQDLETIIYIYADENNQKAWDLNGFEVNLTEDILKEIQNVNTKDIIEINDHMLFEENTEIMLFEDPNESENLKNMREYAERVKPQLKLKEYVVHYMLDGARVSRNNCLGSLISSKKPELFVIRIPKTLGVTSLGIGNGFSINHDNTCFILDADKLYLIDCPEDLRKLGKLEEKINDIILTHNDPDHVGLLYKLIQKKCFRYKQKINLYTIKDVFDGFIQNLHNLQTDLVKMINFVELRTDEPYVLLPDVKICARRNIHGEIPTIGFKFSYKGKTLGYSSDCKFSMQLPEDADKRNADLDKKLRDELTRWDFDSELLDFCLSNNVFTSTNPSTIPSCEPCPHSDVNVDAKKLALFYKNVSGANDVEAELSGCSTNPSHNSCFIKLHYKFEDGKTGMLPVDLTLIKHLYDFAKAVEHQKFDVKQLHPNWFSDCDLIIHEATDNPTDPVHTYVGELEKLPEKLKEKMRLVHIPDGFECKHYRKLSNLYYDSPNAIEIINSDARSAKTTNPKRYQQYINKILPMRLRVKYLI